MFAICTAALCVFAAGASPAFADGGTVILHRDAGPFAVTLFAPGIPLQAGQTDLSVLVQDRQSGEVLFDPEVDVTAMQTGQSPELKGGSSQAPIPVRLTHAMATNRLLQAANVRFSRPGTWLIDLNVRQGTKAATLSTELSIEPNRSRARMVWFYLLLPVAIILLFAAHQTLKAKQKFAA